MAKTDGDNALVEAIMKALVAKHGRAAVLSMDSSDDRVVTVMMDVARQHGIPSGVVLAMGHPNVIPLLRDRLEAFKASPDGSRARTLAIVLILGAVGCAIWLAIQS